MGSIPSERKSCVNTTERDLQGMQSSNSIAWLLSLTVVAICLYSHPALAGGKAGMYLIRMVPYGTDAESYSRAGWGGGLRAVVPVPQVSNLFAGTAGIEVVNLLSGTETFRDRSGLAVDQETNQNYFRLYLGGQVGGHGNGFLRPHVGANIAFVFYNIQTDAVVKDSFDPSKEIRQNLSNVGSSVFGYDVTLGLDLNFSNKLALDGGVRYLKSFSVPAQLGEGSLKIFPQYFQVYFEVGLGFEAFGNNGENGE